jgi:HK97 family phage prohead protease
LSDRDTEEFDALAVDGDAPIDGEPWKRAAEVVDVSYPDRVIKLVVIPYEQPTAVQWQGRTVTETIVRGAFNGIERRANRVRVNREHERMQTVGRAVTFHPGGEQGLLADIKISRTPLGDETLELAADGCLGASAGFLPMKSGMQWQNRDSYQITRAFLKHIAMTSEPAYEGAEVLEVRSAVPAAAVVSATPNLDEYRSWRLELELASAGNAPLNYQP